MMKTLCTTRSQHHVISRMLHVYKHSETCHFGADLRQLPLAGIAPKRAHGPERVGGVDPGGLWGFLHIGLDVWVDLRGRGRQLCACHGSLPPECYLQQRAANMFPPPGVGTSSVSDRRRRKTASPFHWCCTKAEGERLPLCRITGSSDTLRGASVCLLVMERSSITHGDVRSPCVCKILTSSRSNVNRLANPTGSPTRYITKMVKYNDTRILFIITTCQSFTFIMSSCASPGLHFYKTISEDLDDFEA